MITSEELYLAAQRITDQEAILVLNRAARQIQELQEIADEQDRRLFHMDDARARQIEIDTLKAEVKLKDKKIEELSWLAYISEDGELTQDTWRQECDKVYTGVGKQIDENTALKAEIKLLQKDRDFWYKANQEVLEAHAELEEKIDKGDFTADEIHNFCHNLHGKVSAEEFAAGCAKEQRKFYGKAPDAEDKDRMDWIAKKVAGFYLVIGRDEDGDKTRYTDRYLTRQVVDQYRLSV